MDMFNYFHLDKLENQIISLNVYISYIETFPNHFKHWMSERPSYL